MLKIATVILVKQLLHHFYVYSTVASFITDVFSCQSNTKLPTIHQYYILSIILSYLHCIMLLTTKTNYKVFKSTLHTIVYFMIVSGRGISRISQDSLLFHRYINPRMMIYCCSYKLLGFLEPQETLPKYAPGLVSPIDLRMH